MRDIRVVPATEELARAMAPRMRLEDVREVAASGGYAPLGALLASLESSELSAACLFGGAVGFMWGVQPIRASVLTGRVGAVWMLGTELIDRHPRAFWKVCRREVPRLFEFYDVLINAIDVRNERALRWGERLGFQFGVPRAWGREGLPFRFFSVRKEDLRV